MWRLVVLLLAIVACQPASPPPPTPDARPETRDAGPPPDPAPVRLPEDDAPHDVLTEWWYYTGHLQAESGEEYGFEFVIFQSIRGRHPIGYLAHFAVTDLERERFHYASRNAQRTILPQALDLEVDGWSLRGGGGHDWITAETDDYAIELELRSQKPPVLHQGGYISFGEAGDSYYVSRTRMGVSGRLRSGDTWSAVEGLAWFDHQWGDFIVASVGGWDWFSLQLDDGSELMLAVVREPDGNVVGPFGTYVDVDGQAVDLSEADATIEALGSWLSPHTGAHYPSGWRLQLPGQPGHAVPPMNLTLDPVLLDQELAFEQMPYWEGAVRAAGEVAGQPATGQGYVELVGYR